MKYILIFLIGILIMSGCNSSDDQCSENRDLTIDPSTGIGPYYLGMTEEELVNVLCPEFTKKQESAWFSDKKTTYYFIENMSFIFTSNRLKEINVWGSFKGSYEDIDMDYNKKFLENYGEVIEYKNEYRILDIPHIAFGKENSDEGKYIRVYE